VSISRYKLLSLLGKILLVLIVLTGALGITVFFVANSDWAKEKLRVYIQETIATASGGTAEIASLDYNLGTLEAVVNGFVFHGKERADQAPLFRANRITVDATILSLFARKFRVDSVSVEKPELNVYLYEDGTNNLPKPPGPPSDKPFTHTLMDLGIGRFELSGGVAHLAQETMPLDVLGENLDLTLNFEPASDRYQGAVSAQRLQFSTASIQPVPFDFHASLTLERDRLVVNDGKLSYGESKVDFTTTMDDFQNPKILVAFTGDLRVQDFHREFQLPIEPVGRLSTKGEFRQESRTWRLDGSAEGRGLAFRSGAVRVADISVRSSLGLAPDSLVFSNLVVGALGGEVRGNASLRDGTAFQLRGTANNLSLGRVSRASGVGALAYNSRVSGEMTVNATLGAGGPRNAVVEAKLQLKETEGENPLSGAIDARYEQRGGVISFRDSSLSMANSSVRLSGTIKEGLHVTAEIRRFEDLLPALALVSEKPEELIPVQLGPGGMTRFDGELLGNWNAPTVEGTIAGRAISYQGRSLDTVSAHALLQPEGLHVENLIARKADVELRGSMQLQLKEWKVEPAAPIEASGSLRASGLKTLLAEGGQKDLPLSGTPTLDFRVRGTLEDPTANVSGSVRKGTAWGETFDELRVQASYENRSLSLEDATITRGSAVVKAKGSYSHQQADYETGNGAAEFQLSGLNFNDLTVIRDKNLDAQAQLASQGKLAFHLTKGAFTVDTVDANLALSGIRYEGQPAGSLTLTAKSNNGTAAIALRGDIAGSKLNGDATIGLSESFPAKGSLNLEQLTLDSIRRWLPNSMDQRSLPLEASITTSATFEGSLTKPEQLRAELLVSQLRIATTTASARTLDRRSQFELANAKPLRFAWDGAKLTARDVNLEGTGTKLAISGTISPSNKRTQMDLQARGSLNFKILNAIEPTLDADGVSELDLTVRGTFQTPDVYGLLDLKDASLYLTGVPNGLDKINGRVFLYRDRATIEEIRAESGGGTLTLGGFVSYNEGVPSFRLSARGTDVRVRYPPGVSTSANAELELTGSRNQSILSGNVSITRVALNPRSDLGSILANTAKPVATPSASQNDFLRNMRFDVRVQTASDVRFDSTLTQDLAGEADLRLRGNPYTPVLLGTVTVTQGEVNFFGNQYFIDRGEISFLNPLKMEPVLNLDLRTRVRSIDVTLTFSGPLDKLNINYRSDPPLPLNEIIALITVGRAPANSPSLAQAQNEAAQSWQQIGASALVGQAVAAPVAGRLQKFFGVSRIKIDPRLTGVENNPQARLTVEQQVNRDITVTFITNLAGAQQQIVRLEWNFNPDWSMVALRDEDGLFGIDFLYRKRF